MKMYPEEFHQLSFYTLAHPDADYFIHQHIVDVYHVQTANSQTKEITFVFSLLGLYLFLEKGYTGKQVQLIHMKIAKKKPKTWPTLSIPEKKADLNITDVLEKKEGKERDDTIKDWCVAVWNIHSENQTSIREFTDPYLSD